VPHHRVPDFIGAADLCLAPYRVSAFPDESVAFSTLKIPEYMACGRPVASVPSGHIQKLVEDQVSGFLFPNDISSWVSFLRRFPSRDTLKYMGDAALRSVESISWEGTARQYLKACHNLAPQRSVENMVG
jgi:glycosyltransferase involved in cell wall biosynthesis